MLTVIQWEFQKYKYANDAQHTLFNNYFKNKTMFNKVIHINTNGVLRGATMQNHHITREWFRFTKVRAENTQDLTGQTQSKE